MLNSNKGLSGIITMVLLVALVVVAVAIVGVVLKNLISEEIEGTESCFGNYNKVLLNGLYTCYSASSNELRFSLSIGDIDVDEILVSISRTGTTKSFTIDGITNPLGVTNYPSGLGDIELPGKNSGLTYVYNLTEGSFSGKPDKIEIAPTINEKPCDVSDSLSSIDNCGL